MFGSTSAFRFSKRSYWLLHSKKHLIWLWNTIARHLSPVSRLSAGPPIISSVYPSSDLIGPVRPHQWQHQATALITAVRMKEARLMSSDRGMCTRDLDKKQGSVIAPRPPVFVRGNRCHRAPVMCLVGNMYITAFRSAIEQPARYMGRGRVEKRRK